MPPLPSLPSLRTWSSGDLVTVPRLRADLENAVALLAQRPHLIGQCTTGETFTSANDVVVTLDSELTDSWNAHLAGSADYWAPLPGYYLCDARMPFAYTSSTPAPFMAGWSGLNNSATIPLTHGALTVNGSTSATVIARAVDLLPQTLSGSPNGSGDLIQPFARQDSGGTVNLGTTPAADLPTVSIRWVSALTGTQPLPVPPLTPVPSPITSAWLNANLRDVIRFLVYPPVMKAHYTAGSSTLASGTLASPAIVPLTTVDVDTYGAFTTGSSAHYTAPVAGRYFLAGQFNLATSSTTQWHACGLQVNGTTNYWGRISRFAGSALAGGASVTKRLRLNAGDTVALIGTQSSGSATAYNTTASNQTRLIAVWEGI